MCHSARLVMSNENDNLLGIDYLKSQCSFMEVSSFMEGLRAQNSVSIKNSGVYCCFVYDSEEVRST